MEIWFSDFSTPNIKLDIRVTRQLFSGMSDIQQVVANTDNRLGRNRAKMEEGLKANDKKPAKKAAAPVAKKAAPAPAAKKAASKAEAKAEPTEDPKAKARAALLKAAAAKKAKASKK